MPPTVSALSATHRQRRSPARARILDAARELFTTSGYRGATTKEISLLARVAEPTLFRHFGSKAELFEATILEPFRTFIDGWTQSWHDFPTESSVDLLAQNLVDGLYQLVRTDRRLFQELIVARTEPDSDLYQSALTISSQLRVGLRAVHDVGLDIARAQALKNIDAAANIGAVASMVIGAVLLEDWVYPMGVRTPSQTRIVQEMAALIAHGISHRA